ncbi:S1C family serine protease [Agathobaculum sp.]|mgnify:FL=1|uniref:S1C family serine protease n=1 Tax=Agathobaculum sp. TaxID=2048138 RepID=UPI0027BA884C|nr:trypsin-like peptidase domain-containing protein [Agathobaculum sp.]
MYRNQETHTFDPDVSHALVLYEPSNADRPRPQKRHPFLWKGVALVLCCCLLSGGAVWSMTGGGALVIPQGAVVTPVVLNTAASGKAIRDAAIYAAAVNSVVSINTTSQAGVNIFGQPVQAASSGSGFILSSDGYILTSYHVVQDASSVQVTTYGGDTFQAQVIGGDADYDIAVLKVSASGLQRAVLGNSDTLNVGDRVLAIGNPLGELTFSLSGGMVSSVNRAINVSGIPFHMIQTDTSINPGNSGGPLLNTSGEVVGIVSAKYSSSNGKIVEGIGFAIPINDMRAMVQDIIDNGSVTNKPYLGVTAGTVNMQMSQQAGLSQGVCLYAVDLNGAAAAAGLQAGDIITQIDGTAVQSMPDLSAAKKSYSAGDTAQFTVIRGGQTIQVPVTWGTEPVPSASASQHTQDQAGQVYGGNRQSWHSFSTAPYYGG